MGGLESTEQLVERVHHLLCQAASLTSFWYLRAVFQEGGDLAAGQAKRRCSERSRRNLSRGDARRSGSGRLSGSPSIRSSRRGARRSGEPRWLTRRPAGTSAPLKQALGPALGRSLQPAGAGHRLVEVLPRIEHLHQKLPRRLIVARVALADGEVGVKGLAIVGERNLELRRNRSLLRAGIAFGREAPAQHGSRRCGSRGGRAPDRARD